MGTNDARNSIIATTVKNTESDALYKIYSFDDWIVGLC